MDDLSKLGFSSEVMLNHTGQFEGFLDEVRAQGSLPVPREEPVVIMERGPCFCLMSFRGEAG